MNMFRKRPLCLILCIWLGVFFLFSLKIILLRVALAVLCILPLIISHIFKFDELIKRKAKVICSVSIVAMIFSFGYFDIYFAPYDRFDGSVKIVGTITDYSPASSYSTKLVIETESIGNQPFSQYKIVAYLSKEDASKMPEGTKISFTARLCDFSSSSKNYNTSIGISAYADEVEDIKIIEHSSCGVSLLLSRYREWLSRYITSITDSESGSLLSALLFGERDNLSGQVRLDFKRIGISHILALSGMHLAILSLGIGKLLSFLGVKKKTRLIATSIFILGYMALTGFPVSVMRAGFMLIIASLLFVLSHGKDSLTSLATSVFIICILDPCAIFSTSLWLSALATLGIIVLGEYTSQNMKKPQSVIKSTLQTVWIGMMASVFAISATLAISTITFGGMSIVGIFTTLIFSIVVEIIMYLGCIALFIGAIIPIKFLISPLTMLVFWLAELLSGIELVYVSTNYPLIVISIIIYTFLFYLFFVIKVQEKRKAVIFLVSVFLFINITPLVCAIIKDFDEEIIYTSDSKCDELLVRSGGRVCLINSSQYSRNLAYTGLDLLEETKVTYLDAYYLTHYSWSIDDELKVLLSNVSVGRIYLPEPKNEDETTILNVIKKTVEGYRTKITLIKKGDLVRVGKYKIDLLYHVAYGETSMNAFTVQSDNEKITYISSGILNGSLHDFFDIQMTDSTAIILGEHGKKYKDSTYIDTIYKNVVKLILNSENLLLSDEATNKYINSGCDVVLQPENTVIIK